MTDRQTFILVSPRIRANALAALNAATDGYVVTISPRSRSLDQNALLHALLSDLARSPLTWAGKRRTLDEWKMLMISAHAVATDGRGEVIPGIEGEFVAIRESSAGMSARRAASLIEYLTSFCVTNGVELHETKGGGRCHDPLTNGTGVPTIPLFRLG